MGRILIEGGWVLPMDDGVDVIEGGLVAIENDRIVAVADKASFDIGSFRADKVISASRQAVLPGLINTHIHLIGGLNKAISEDVCEVSGGLYKRIIPLHARYVSATDAYWPSMIHAVECLKTGTTCVNENWWHQTASAEVMRDLGVRGILAEAIREIDLSTVSASTAERRWDPDIAKKSLDDTVKLIEEWHGHANGRITCKIGPLAADVCSEKTLLRAKELADQSGLGLHVHVAQMPSEVAYITRAYSKSSVKFLCDLGLLDENFIAIHCVFLEEGDVEILRNLGVKVSHTPYLAGKRAYFPPIGELYKAGVFMSFGSDWLSNDMWKIMRIGIIAARLLTGEVGIRTGQDALRMATIDGARCLGMENEIGSLAAGKKADVILVDLNTAWCNPIRVEDLAANLVYNANGSDVRTVIVDGAVVVEDGILRTVDEAEVIRAAQKVADRVWLEAKTLFA